MISSVNNKQTAIEYELSNRNGDSGITDTRISSSSLSSPDTNNTSSSVNYHADTGFSIYNKNIDFDANYTSNYTYNKAFTKDTTTEPNCLLKTNVNNNKEISTIAASELENVHNYSKHLHDNEDPPYSVDHAEDNSNELPYTSSNIEEKNTPDHHARRPMNAFLIFCKRHRAIVREKYPNLENRSITKILGDWWANLENEDKTSYTNLAKQYKDAFFSANPTFKWYKLPAPPLRTLTTRPSNAERPVFLNFPYDIYRPSSKPTLDLVTYSTDEGHEKRKIKPSNVGMFKLADETQMGSLNDLMISYDSKTKPSNNNLGEDYSQKANTSPQNELQSTLSEASSYLAKTMSLNRTEHLAAANQGSDHLLEYMPTAKRKFNDQTFGISRHLLPSETEYLTEYDEDGSKKSSRACKGKRYLEFMGNTKTGSSSKKAKQSHYPNQNGYYGLDGSSHNDYEMFDHMYATQAKSNTEMDKINGDVQMSATAAADANLKLFNASDFELEEKIKALPSLSLDKYLSRKKDTKKKKKIGKRSTTVKPPQTIQEAKEMIKKAMVGSQKRKARKESITRRDIVSPTPCQFEHALDASTDCGSIVFTQTANVGFSTENKEDISSDLLILATIAEKERIKSC